MRNLLCSVRRIAVLVSISLPVIASAHPGHDDPDFTWEYSHLVAHPGATMLCFGSVIAGSLVAWYFVGRSRRVSAKR